MVFIVKPNVLFLQEIYCVFSNEVEFGSMEFDFDHLCVFSNEVEFGSMGFDFEHLRGNFGHL